VKYHTFHVRSRSALAAESQWLGNQRTPKPRVLPMRRQSGALGTYNASGFLRSNGYYFHVNGSTVSPDIALLKGPACEGVIGGKAL